MTDNIDTISRANRARAALDEFIGPAFDLMRAEYALGIQQVAAATPWEVDKIRNLAQAVKVLDDVRAQVTAVIGDGAIAQHDMARAAKIASIPARKRGLLGLGA